MGSFAGSNGAAEAELQMLILGKLKHRRRLSVVSVNALIDDIRETMPSCIFSNNRLAEIISEAAMLMGLVPVFDPTLVTSDFDGEIYGYGHRAHRPDPFASYVFKPGPPRTLRVREIDS
jgi:hypothetical protein